MGRSGQKWCHSFRGVLGYIVVFFKLSKFQVQKMTYSEWLIRRKSWKCWVILTSTSKKVLSHPDIDIEAWAIYRRQTSSRLDLTRLDVENSQTFEHSTSLPVYLFVTATSVTPRHRHRDTATPVTTSVTTSVPNYLQLQLQHRPSPSPSSRSKSKSRL